MPFFAIKHSCETATDDVEVSQAWPAEILPREAPVWAEFALESRTKSLRQNKLELDSTIKLLRTFNTTPSWTDSEEELRNVNDFISQLVIQIVGSEADFRRSGRSTSDVWAFFEVLKHFQTLALFFVASN